jgi:hypothetical protein
MAGTLGKVELSQPADLDTGSQQLGLITSYALGYVQSKGIPIPGSPTNGFLGDMPSTLTSLGDDELGDLLNNLSEWCAYLDGQLAIADSERKAAEADYEFRKARIRMAIKASEDGKKVTSKDKDDIMTTDPRVLQAWQRSLYTESSYQIIRAIANKAQRNWETASRRITQRGQEIERHKRENSVAGVPANTRSFRRT